MGTNMVTSRKLFFRTLVENSRPMIMNVLFIAIELNSYNLVLERAIAAVSLFYQFYEDVIHSRNNFLVGDDIRFVNKSG